MRNRILTGAFFLLAPFFATAQDEALQDIGAFQKKLNAEYRSAKKSPLEAKARKKFKKHDFFPVDVKYRVYAVLTVTENTSFFKMKTTTDRLPLYRKYGFITFTIDEVKYRLPVYQSQDGMGQEAFKDYLFLPFTDLTNGTESYSGGRYLELRIPKEGDTVLVDFNKAYNPYCAYNPNYSCPIVPVENHLNVAIPAGVKYSSKEKAK
jgi:uncharacterized protein